MPLGLLRADEFDARDLFDDHDRPGRDLFRRNELCPSLSISSIEKVMAKMVEEGKLEKGGSGRTTYYIIKL